MNFQFLNFSASQSQSQYMDGSQSLLSGWSQSQSQSVNGKRSTRGAYHGGSTQQMSQDMDDVEQKMADLLLSQDC